MSTSKSLIEWTERTWIDCGHKVATRERRVMYPCRNCAAPKGGA